MPLPPIVHIGIHKTASTWFQKEFFPSVPGAQLVPRKVARLALLEPRVEQFDAQSSREKLLQTAADRRLIVSEENLSGYPHNGGVGGALPKLFAQRIASVLPEAMILIFLRAQPAAIAACYSQYVQSGGTLSARAYVDAQRRHAGARRHWYKVPAFDASYFRYTTLLSTYAGLFERSAIKVFLYEDFVRGPAEFLQHFLGELQLPVETPIGSHAARRNVSLSTSALRIMRALNRFTRRSVADKHYLVDIPQVYEMRAKLVQLLLGSRTYRPTKPSEILGVELEQELGSHYVEDNRQLAAEWALDVRSAGYPM